MGYTAIEKMRQKNIQLFGADYGPKQPEAHYSPDGFDMKSAALRFLHERCEDLLFDRTIEAKEKAENTLYGKSTKLGQIPYNMQMDLNRLCLERELEEFIDSGNADDAYSVYYCAFELFSANTFAESKKAIELLSEFESNGSALLMKHRDHYSHSVYVFVLGLAIYETNEHFRKAYKSFYHFDTDGSNTAEDRKAAHHFLAYWGMTALFHDIGYPFELPFEQVLSYFEVSGQKRGETNPYLAYCNMETLTTLSDEEKAAFKKLYNKEFSNVEELFSHVITGILGEKYSLSEAHLYEVLHKKPTDPKSFAYHIDHAYFSAIRLYREMVNSPEGLAGINKTHMESLTAILLHNSLYKLSVAFYKSKDPEIRKNPLQMETFPLAYLLFLCDELQCWDRTAYGRNTRQEMHPLAVAIDFSGNALHATYYYDREEQEKIDAFKIQYKQWEQNGEQGEPPRLKEYSDMSEKEARFRTDIEAIVDTSPIPLTIDAAVKTADRRSKRVYLSSSSFLHLYDFAVALNARYAHNGEESGIPSEQLEKEFDSLSLEYQLSNINQAKSFAKYLNAIDCFYTDKPVDFDMLTAFTPEQVVAIAPLEHERWIREKSAMSWQQGEAYRTIPAEKIIAATGTDEKTGRKMLREQFRIHELALDGDPSEAQIREHYHALAEQDKEKDYEPFNSMLKLIKKYDGLRIYQLQR